MKSFAPQRVGNGTLYVRNTGFFVVGFIFPWKRYSVTRDEMTLTFAIGYWFFEWIPDPRALASNEKTA